MMGALAGVSAGAFFAPAFAQAAEARDAELREAFPDWFEETDPFRVVGPVYHAGVRGLNVYLIATDDGHILLDGGLPSTAPIILRNIRALGFDPDDVVYLINSHAHYDHSGGLAELKARTGATFVASAADRPALEGGYYEGSAADASLSAPQVAVDRTIADGEALTLGGVRLTARLTPGHSPGCTSWEMEVEEFGRNLTVLFFCSATVAANRLVDPPQYDGIVEGYRRTFAVGRDWRPDVFLANHPYGTGMWDRLERREAGDAEAFVDREIFPAYLRRLEEAFERALAQQKADAGRPR